jgi:hypothetical protein
MEEREDRHGTEDVESTGECREEADQGDRDVAEAEARGVGDPSPEDESVSDGDAASPEATDEVDRRDDTGEAGMEAREMAGDTLLASDQTVDFRTRWEVIQTGFVDEPRRSVQEADALVTDLMQRLTDTFTEERGRLEGQWDRGDEVSTEELRVAMQRYRAFFNRLLKT